MVVDAQVGVINDAWDASRIIGNIARAVERARAENIPVLWVQHADAELPTDSPQWQWVPELVPTAGEPRIHKQFNSSFEHTTLSEELEALGVSHLVLAGAATNWCIRATAYGALERGYDLTLLSDAHTTGTIQLENGTLIEAAAIVQDLNIAMQWLSYPGRTNGTARTEQIDFTRPGGE
ncbi:isochorismatase family protein [Herpetosiphon gulosus]|uniref:Peroxyureidoacrylate/ureidoacrylate amidohydrolase RutB n=1 Tax=Herpetosiphon gulosus TaxID=1973496 RepID=A0ABP9X6T6_9CHLR